MEYPDLKAKIREVAATQSPAPFALFVEDAANGRPLVQELRRERLPVVGVPPVGSKQSRVAAVSPLFESGLVLLPYSADWLENWIDEHLVFPNGANDDQVDTTSLALSQLSRRFSSTPVELGREGDTPLGVGNMSPRRRKLLRERALAESAGAVSRVR